MIKPEELVMAIARDKQARSNNKGYEERARMEANNLLAAKNEIDQAIRREYPEKAAEIDAAVAENHALSFQGIDTIVHEELLDLLLAIRGDYAPHAPVIQVDRYETFRNGMSLKQRALLLPLPHTIRAGEYNFFGLQALETTFGESDRSQTSEVTAHFYPNSRYSGELSYDHAGILAATQAKMQEGSATELPLPITPIQDLGHLEWQDGAITFSFGATNRLVAPSIHESGVYHRTVDVNEKNPFPTFRSVIIEEFQKTGL